MSIPVFHDDQHGTAIVTVAGIINYLKLSGKSKESLNVVINGSGAAGVALGKLLKSFGVENMVFCDSKGVISNKREDLNDVKKSLLEFSKPSEGVETLRDAMVGADVFVGVSSGNLLESKDIELMAESPAVFAMANPIPEIFPDEAKKGGAMVVATGRSDFENQINNVLVFPGIFKGSLESGVSDIDDGIKLAAAQGLADLVENPTAEKIIPAPFDKGVAEAVSKAVKDSLK